METKRIIAGLIMIVVIAGLITCPALARKYDTMMVGADRWIDTNVSERNCDRANEGIVYYEGDNGDPNELAFLEDIDEPNLLAFLDDDDEPNVITYYDGQEEPNLLVLIYYPEDQPEHPNSMSNQGEPDPNFANLLHQLVEHPEHPNEVSTGNLMLINLLAEHPEPNEISSEERLDPNDIEKIILDEGTANLRRKDAGLPEIS